MFHRFASLNKNILTSSINTSPELHRQRAQSFLKTQQDRLADIEDQLIQATNNILPECSESKTATELAEVVRLVQQASRQKLQLLKARLEMMGYEWEEEPERILSPKTPQTEVHWSVGGHLESVLEGDVETEGATTPGSMIQPSPFTDSKRKNSLTPTTPTLDRFSFSASTKSLLNTMTPSGDEKGSATKQKRSFRMSRSPGIRQSLSPSIRSERQLNFDGFGEEDDMLPCSVRW